MKDLDEASVFDASGPTGEQPSVARFVIQGQSVVYLRTGPGWNGPLAYPHHVEAGDIKLEHMFSESYAHVHKDGHISRYGTRICDIRDFLPPTGPVSDGTTSNTDPSP